MIPKKIHYVWLSGEPLPSHIISCIDSWKKHLPEYEIIQWNKNNFNLDCNKFAWQAFEAKRWAFATDYIRLRVVHDHGGIYLDSDVEVCKNIDEFLSNDFFSAVEYHSDVVASVNLDDYLSPSGQRKSDEYVPGVGVQAAIFGSVRNHSITKSILDFYEKQDFILDDGSFFENPIAPTIYALILEKYGFKYVNKIQYLQNNVTFYSTNEIASSKYEQTDDNYAVHLCAGSWRIRDNSFFQKLRRKLKKIWCRAFSF